jgi:hypothetical protein
MIHGEWQDVWQATAGCGDCTRAALLSRTLSPLFESCNFLNLNLRKFELEVLQFAFFGNFMRNSSFTQDLG